MAKADTVYSMFGMKSPQQVAREEMEASQTLLARQTDPYARLGTALGVGFGRLFGGQSKAMTQAKEREKIFAETEQELATTAKNEMQADTEAFVNDLTPENFGTAIAAEERMRNENNPFQLEIKTLNERADKLKLMAQKFKAAGQPADYTMGLEQEALKTRMLAYDKMREMRKYEQDTAKGQLDMELGQARLKELQDKNKLTPKDLVEIQLKATPESYQKWIKGEGLLVPNPKAFAGKSTPAAIQEYEYFMNLPDDAARARYLQVKSASNWKDTGPTFDLIVDGRVIHSITKGLAPKDQPVNIAESEQAKAVGQQLGKDKLGAPAALANIETFRTSLLDLRNHKGFGNIFGPLADKLAGIQGTQAFGANAQLNKVRGSAFLQQVDKMRGLGALSENEGKALVASATKLQLGLPEADAKKEIELQLMLLDRAEDRVRNNTLLTPEQVINNPLILEQRQRTAGGVTYEIIGD